MAETPELNHRETVVGESRADAVEAGKAASEDRARLLRTGVELVAVALIAAATLATAWSGYQASRWGGVQSVAFGQASARRLDSAKAAARANQREAIDVLLFSSYLNAVASDQDELAAFYEARFRPEFLPAFAAWLATDPINNPDAPPSPFALPEYQLADRQLADQLEAEAAEQFDDGRRANQRSDDYVLTAVILATVLFFAGIASRMRLLATRGLVVGLGTGMLALGLYRLATMPIE